MSFRISGICSNKAITDDYDGYLWKTEEAQSICNSLPGLPLLLEHNKDHVIGRVLNASLSSTGYVRILAEIYKGAPLGMETIERIKTKHYMGFSCGQKSEQYKKSKYKIGIRNKQVWEISVVAVPNVKCAVIEFFETDKPMEEIALRGEGKVLFVGSNKQTHPNTNTIESPFKNGAYKFRGFGGINLPRIAIEKESKKMAQPAPTGQQVPPQQLPPQAVQQPTGQQVPPQQPGTTEQLFNNPDAQKQNTEISAADKLKFLIENGQLDPEKILMYTQKGVDEEKKKGEEARAQLLNMFQMAYKDPQTQAKDLYEYIQKAPAEEMQAIAPIAFVATSASAVAQQRLSTMEKELEEMNKKYAELERREMEHERNKRIKLGVDNLFVKPVQQNNQQSYSNPQGGFNFSGLSIPRNYSTTQIQPNVAPTTTTAATTTSSSVVVSTTASGSSTPSQAAPSKPAIPYGYTDPYEAKEKGVSPNQEYWNSAYGSLYQNMVSGMYNFNEADLVRMNENARKRSQL
jgi:hypothetical protein